MESRLWLHFRAPVSLQDAGSGYVCVPQKNPRVKETLLLVSGRVNWKNCENKNKVFREAWGAEHPEHIVFFGTVNEN